MMFQWIELPVNGYVVIGFVISIILITKLTRRPNLRLFPAVGSNNWFMSWWDALGFFTHAQDLIQAGYKKHAPAPFKIAELARWTVYLSNRTHLEELSRAADDEFSFLEGIHDQLQTKYTVGHDLLSSTYHMTLVRSQLTRNIDIMFPEIRDEIITSFDDVLSLSGHEWTRVPVLGVMEQVVCRASNRAFVGLPLCRHPDWIDLNLVYTGDIIKGGIIAGFFPDFMRPWVVRYLTKIPRSIARGMRLLGPIIEERRKCLDQFGKDWHDKPNDLLSWLMDEDEGEGQESKLSIERLTRGLLVFNFAAVQTSSHMFTHALFYLAANPQSIQPLREEVEGIVEKDGWTKTALGKMHKVDSFVKECLRMQGIKLTTLSRKALKDFTFSDGTCVPKGTLVVAATQCLHYDDRHYAHAETFEPFRFANPNAAGDASKGTTRPIAALTTDFLPFGLGRHACTGRNFAAVLLKAILAHVVVTYDVQLHAVETQTRTPPVVHIGSVISADRNANILIRHRAR